MRRVATQTQPSGTTAYNFRPTVAFLVSNMSVVHVDAHVGMRGAVIIGEKRGKHQDASQMPEP